MAMLAHTCLCLQALPPPGARALACELSREHLQKFFLALSPHLPRPLSHAFALDSLCLVR